MRKENKSNNQVVLVTGPTGNLGSAVVQKFLAEGARMLLIDRSPDRLTSTYPLLEGNPDHLLIPGVDLTDFTQVDSAVQLGKKTLGQIDCLVHTAGGFQMGERVHEISMESWDHLMNLNLKTLLNITRAAIPTMIQQKKGKVITIGARPALSGKARMGAYSVSKAGVVRLTETMAAELKREGINVNCVIPGTIDTPQNRQAMPDADRSRWTSPDSLAEVIYFLCSQGAKDIHGATIPVYGA
jgi:NAD(P)-dependent dehydrogenase (short-subunit alcohol dehydrogenase family)